MDPTSSPDRTIVVGVDGSASAERAVQWAAREAARTAARLRIVTTWSIPVLPWGPAGAPAYVEPGEIEAGAEAIVNQAAVSARQILGDSDVSVDKIIVLASAPEGLLSESRSASMLVVGTRGRGGLTSLLLGSVATACAHHAVVPTVLVGDHVRQPGDGEIVVGIDGSAGARTALRWAIGEAAQLGVAIRAVHAWDIPASSFQDGAAIDPLADPDLSQAATRWLEELVAAEAAALPGSVPTSVVSVANAPAEALVQEAETASLLVVGSRGTGGFRGLLLGSVSHQCLHRSPCPIAIVPSPTGDEGAGTDEPAGPAGMGGIGR